MNDLYNMFNKPYLSVRIVRMYVNVSKIYHFYKDLIKLDFKQKINRNKRRI